MPKWIALALGLSLTVALLTLAACGGGASTNASTTAPPSGRATATQTPDVLSQLQALGGDIKQARAKITYAETDSSGSTTSITYYSIPPNVRYDTMGSDGSTSVYIYTPPTTYTCTSTDQICLRSADPVPLSADQALLSGFLSSSSIDAVVAAAQAQGVSITKSSQNIAGTDTACYSGEYNGSAEKFCFSDIGALLAEQTTKADGTTSGLTATVYSGDVPNSDFLPPYPVPTISPIPTG